MSEKQRLQNLICAFQTKYGEGNEVKVPSPVLTVYDNYANPFSSGSNGYITKLRINKSTHKFEYFHDWWAYGWEFDAKYTDEAICALEQVTY